MDITKTMLAIYYDYVNNYLTEEAFASQNGIDRETMKLILQAGRNLAYNSEVA